MTALPKTALSDDIRNEIARLKGAGFHPLPLGGGDLLLSSLSRWAWSAWGPGPEYGPQGTMDAHACAP